MPPVDEHEVRVVATLEEVPVPEEVEARLRNLAAYTGLSPEEAASRVLEVAFRNGLRPGDVEAVLASEGV